MATPRILTGDNLSLALATVPSHPATLIDELIYAGDVVMLCGEPGTGKSILALQLAVALSSGTAPLFDFLAIPAPRHVYYLQLEGRVEQNLERLNRMQPVLPVNAANLCLDYRTTLDLLDPLQAKQLVNDIAAWMPPDLIIIDPLYQAVYGQLAKEMPSKALVRFLDAARSYFQECSFLLVHHTKKPSYAGSGERIVEDDPFYGSQWLKAYMDTSFLVQPGGGRYRGESVKLICKKSRGANVIHDLILHYQPETDTVTADVPPSEQSGYERVSKFLYQLRKVAKTTNFYEVQEQCQLSTRQLRSVQLILLKEGKLRCDKRSEHRKIWEPL